MGTRQHSLCELHCHNYVFFTYLVFQDNSLREWSFKKAITIRAYSSYHPVPVPFNLITITVSEVWRLCQSRKNNRFNETGFDERGMVSYMRQSTSISFFDSAELEHIKGKWKKKSNDGYKIMFAFFIAVFEPVSICGLRKGLS